MSQKTWGGRFDGSTDARVEAFTESISFDARLGAQDIRGSMAHAAMLAEVGLLTTAEAAAITQALTEIGTIIDAGQMPFRTSLEDIHTHIEQALIAQLGDTGRKLHTARSRNDQIVTDVKLWVRDAIDQIDEQLLELQRAFVASAERDADVILPGYTHLQRAQPVLAAHYYLAYVEKLQRDRERLADCRKRVNILPLGAAALAGTSLPIDRRVTMARLGFEGLAANSLDVSSDRDFLLEFVFVQSIIAVHLSGWAEEWVIWSTTEFNFLKVPDAFCTGSSIMPQKKNPDVLELVRGKSARVIAALQELFLLVKGLPLAYNRDLQEDKRALFAATDTLTAMLGVAAPLVRQTELNRPAIAAQLDAGFLDATTLMEAFIRRGVPMRTAHEAVGGLVKRCEAEGCRLADLDDAAFDAVVTGGAAIRQTLGVANAVAAFQSVGSTAPAEVAGQVAAWQKRLQNQGQS
jgi:argininosuccinate lyase